MSKVQAPELKKVRHYALGSDANRSRVGEGPRLIKLLDCVGRLARGRRLFVHSLARGGGSCAHVWPRTRADPSPVSPRVCAVVNSRADPCPLALAGPSFACVQYMDKLLFIKLQGNRTVSGYLRGFDIFLNLVLDEVREEGSADKVECGTVVSHLSCSTPTLRAGRGPPEDGEANRRSEIKFVMTGHPREQRDNDGTHGDKIVVTMAPSSPPRSSIALFLCAKTPDRRLLRRHHNVQSYYTPEGHTRPIDRTGNAPLSSKREDSR